MWELGRICGFRSESGKARERQHPRRKGTQSGYVVRSALQGEQGEGGRDIRTSGSAGGSWQHSCGWLRNWLEGVRQSHRLRVEGNGELGLHGAASLSGDGSPLSCGRHKLYAKEQGRRQWPGRA